MEALMATKFRIPFKNAVIAKGLPTSGAGSAESQPVRNGGLNGVNLWGTHKGVGVPTTGGYGMIALDGVVVTPVVITTTAVNENDPIYITAAQALSNQSAGNTLFGYADEPGAIGTVTIGVRISNAVGA
jgi:hypothetical protein